MMRLGLLYQLAATASTVTVTVTATLVGAVSVSIMSIIVVFPPLLYSKRLPTSCRPSLPPAWLHYMLRMASLPLRCAGWRGPVWFHPLMSLVQRLPVWIHCVTSTAASLLAGVPLRIQAVVDLFLILQAALLLHAQQQQRVQQVAMAQWMRHQHMH